MFKEKDLVKPQNPMWEKLVPLSTRLDIKNKNFPIERHSEIIPYCGESFLQMAIAWSEDLDCVNYLISLGVDLCHRDMNGSDILHYAVGRINMSRVEMTKLLLSLGVELNNAITSGAYKGYTALHVACSNNSELDVPKLLVEAGADINARDADGYTPLCVANMDSYCPGLEDYLIANGAVK